MSSCKASRVAPPPSVLVLVAALLAVGSCGFQPLYGGYREGQAPAELATVEVMPVAGRLGQQLHNNLLDLLTPRGRPERPLYVLHVTLKERTEHLAVAKSELATRANYLLTAEYELSRVRGGQLLKGKRVVVSSYDIVSSEFATLIAEKDVKSRVVRELADHIRARLAVYFVQRRRATGKAVK